MFIKSMDINNEKHLTRQNSRRSFFLKVFYNFFFFFIVFIQKHETN